VLSVLAALMLALTGCVAVGARTVTVQQVGPSLATPTRVLASSPTPDGPLTGQDICRGISRQVVGQAIGGRIASVTPLEDSPIFGVGCQYKANKKPGSQVVYYANLYVAPESQFEAIRSISADVTPVTGIGDDAYTATRPDGPELWVLVRGRGAAGVAIGGAWSVNRARLLASYVVALLPDGG